LPWVYARLRENPLEEVSMLEIIVVGVVAALGGAVRLEQIREGECGLVMRLGRHRRTVGPGPCLLLRGVEGIIRIPTKIIVFRDLLAEKCRTSDGVMLTVRYHLRLRVAAPAKVLTVEDWQEASLAQAEVVVRNAVTSRTVAALLTERSQVGTYLSAELDQVIWAWGAVGEIEIADLLILSRS
jgi:regulator of protease activity HflC (stomatin/prohibitin superfamily)